VAPHSAGREGIRDVVIISALWRIGILISLAILFGIQKPGEAQG
jgi:hypothetical protein